MKIYILLLFVPFCYSDWESEWLIPIKDTYGDPLRNTPEGVNIKMSDDEPLRATRYFDDGDQLDGLKNKDILYGVISGESQSSSLTQKLRNTLNNARALSETLKSQIISTASRENYLKEMIVSGRSGVTVLTVILLGQLPRTYIIRDGFWTLCNGMVQFPINGHGSLSVFNDLFATPRCIGQEVATRQDPCVFNSIIKYETIPRQRGVIYSEDDYLCLKSSFNNTLEQYLSVPQYIVNETCRDGTVRKITDNSLQCGLRVMSEYTYYPHRSSVIGNLPFEYCSEKDRACKLTVAWHISNNSIENFEFIKNDKAFKKFFMNSNVLSRSL